MRPRAIQLFDRLYLASIALSVIATIIGWDSLVAQAQSVEGAEQMAAMVTGGVAAVVYVIELLLWYLVARRGSVVAKWLVIVLFALNLWGVLDTVSWAMQGSLAAVLTLASIVVQAVAIAMLFRPDARDWFAGRDEAEETPPGAPIE